MKKEKSSAGMVITAVTLIMTFCIGPISTFGVFMPFILEAMPEYSMAQILLTSSFSTATSFLCGLLIGKIMSKFTPRWTVTLFPLAIPVHLLIFSVSTKPWMLYLAAALCGVGTASLNAPCTVIIKRWFAVRQNSMISIMVAGMSIGAAVFVAGTGQLLTYFHWRVCYRILAATSAMVILPASLLFIRNDPADKGEVPYGHKQAASHAASNHEAEVILTGVDASTAFRSTSFVIMFVAVILSTCIGKAVMNLTVSFLSEQGISPATASSYLSIQSIVSIFATMLAGIVADKFGPKVYMGYAACSIVIGISLFALGAPSGLYIILGLIVNAFGAPISQNAPPMLVSSCFGNKDYPKIIGVVMAASQLGNAIVAPVCGFLVEQVGYRITFLAMGTTTAIGILLMITSIHFAPIKKLENAL